MIILITLLVLASPFLAIGILYFYFKINVFDNPDFWYGYMSFFGTVLLGAIALLQNKKANLINDKLLKTQEELQEFQIKEKASLVGLTPMILDKEREYFVVKDDDYSDEFDIVNQKYKYMFFMDSKNINRENSKLFDMVFEIENISNVILKQLHIDNFKLYDIITNASEVSDKKSDIREYHYRDDDDKHINITLKPTEKIAVCFKIDIDEYDMTNESFFINFDLTTVSAFNVIFTENINMMRNNVVDTKDRIFMNTQNSRIRSNRLEN